MSKNQALVLQERLIFDCLETKSAIFMRILISMVIIGFCLIWEVKVALGSVKNIVEYKITSPTVVRIGEHLLKLTPHEIKSDLFVTKIRVEEMPKSGSFVHQVVVKKKGLVVETVLLAENENYLFLSKGKPTNISPTKEFNWSYHTFGDVVVQNRRTRVKKIEISSVEKVNTLLDRNLKKPLLFASALMFILTLAAYFSPKFVKEDLNMIQPKMNQYTRVIYDSKSTAKSKARAKQMTEKISNHVEKKTSKGSQPTTNNNKNQPKRAVVEVSKKLQKSGLSQLIGKISKRSITNSIKIVSKGVSADKKSGRAVASVPSVSQIYSKDKNNSKNFKLNVVSTKGKGGGDQDYKDSGSLTSSNVGSADVGLIEEEAEVRGGLEKEVIARYIQSQIGQVRYCYERQLSANPDLYGKITLKFTIGSSGEIVGKSIGASTLKKRYGRGMYTAKSGGMEVS